MIVTPTSPIDLADIRAARQRIRGRVHHTPCLESFRLSETTGCRLHCKLEYLQRTGSFKERGAANAIAQLDDAQRQRGIIAASAGNHALALAYHGRQAGVPVTVVMPQHAPLMKSATCRQLGANVVTFGQSFSQSQERAHELADRDGLTYVHGFDHPHIIAGQGTLALELLEEVPDVEVMVVPIGGGGLIAGMGIAVKALRPEVRLIGVEPAHMPSYAAAVDAGRPVRIDARPTLADGLAVGCMGALTFDICRTVVDEVVAVNEAELSLAVLRLMEQEKAVVEGAGAAPLAAILGPLRETVQGKAVAIPLCGGNIDPTVLSRVIQHGLAHDGRLHRLTVEISDRVGGLNVFTALLAKAGASINEITHDRTFAGPDPSRVQVHAVIQTHDRPHFEAVIQQLQDANITVTRA